MNLQEHYSNKRVWISGHAGFKGSWLSHWLLRMGATVQGYGHRTNYTPRLFDTINLKDRMEWTDENLLYGYAIKRSILDFKPDIVIHLAAQTIVLESYYHPVSYFEHNLVGAVNVLDALRNLSTPCYALFVTTDKVYAPSAFPLMEDEPLGGNDPYSASKACVEFAVASYRESFFKGTNIQVGTARAGNVIGGGDYTPHRLIPDTMKAFANSSAVEIRNPSHRRPWLYVLDALRGYLMLCMKQLPEAFNFGPPSNATVKQVLSTIQEIWPGEFTLAKQPPCKENPTLSLATGHALRCLNWQPLLDIEESVQRTVEWYHQVHLGNNPYSMVDQQIDAYERLLS